MTPRTVRRRALWLIAIGGALIAWSIGLALGLTLLGADPPPTLLDIDHGTTPTRTVPGNVP